MKTISDNIRYYRNLNGWSQEEIADKLDVSLPTYSRIERNIHGVSLKRIEQLAVIFGITLTELVSFGNKKPTENEITALRKTIQEKDKEIMFLQQKIIDLLERLDNPNYSTKRKY